VLRFNYTLDDYDTADITPLTRGQNIPTAFVQPCIADDERSLLGIRIVGTPSRISETRSSGAATVDHQAFSHSFWDPSFGQHQARLTRCS